MADNENRKKDDLEELEAKYMKLRSAVIVWGVVMIVVMLLIVVVSIVYIAGFGADIQKVVDAANSSGSAEISVMRNNLLSADYLAIVIPVLVALVGGLLTFLGMNRLKMFDDRIDKTRADMLSEIDGKVEQVSMSSQAKIQNEISEVVDKKNKGTLKQAHEVLQACEKTRQDAEHAVEDGKGTIEAATRAGLDAIDKKVSDFGEQYDWLGTAVAEREVNMDFYTVSDAHILVESLRSEKPEHYVNTIRRIVAEVVGNASIVGDADDYHNLATELARGSMYNEASDVLEAGLKLFGTDSDLLSDLVEYTTKMGDIERARKAVVRLDALDKKLWTWRCYEFEIDYYKSIGNLNRAYEMSVSFIESFPYDERGYRNKAEIESLIFTGAEGVKRACDTLQLALDRGVNCPQCANNLGEIMLSMGEYDKAISCFERAISECAQGQSHINIAYVYFNRGVAYDRTFFEGADEQSEGLLKREYATKACDSYQMALALDESHLEQLSATTKKQAIIRLNVLDPGNNEGDQD